MVAVLAVGVDWAIRELAHGNSLSSNHPAYVYSLRFANGAVAKYGNTGRYNPISRYAGWYYLLYGVEMNVEGLYPNRAQARARELELCQQYIAQNGHLPPLSKRC